MTMHPPSPTRSSEGAYPRPPGPFLRRAGRRCPQEPLGVGEDGAGSPRPRAGAAPQPVRRGAGPAPSAVSSAPPKPEAAGPTVRRPPPPFWAVGGARAPLPPPPPYATSTPPPSALVCGAGPARNRAVRACAAVRRAAGAPSRRWPCARLQVRRWRRHRHWPIPRAEGGGLQNAGGDPPPVLQSRLSSHGLHCILSSPLFTSFQKGRFNRRLEEVAKAVGGGYCRLQMPLRLALGVRETVAGHRLGALEGGRGDPPPPPNASLPPRMVTCELSRVCCWLRRRQQQISTCRPQEEEKSPAPPPGLDGPVMAKCLNPTPLGKKKRGADSKKRRKETKIPKQKKRTKTK